MKIFLAIDGPAPSQNAIEEVARRPWPSPSTLRILSVIQPYTPPAPEIVLASATLEEVRQRQAQDAEQLTQQAREGVSASGLSVETAVREGDPRTAIIDAADEWQAPTRIALWKSSDDERKPSHSRNTSRRVRRAAQVAAHSVDANTRRRRCGTESPRTGVEYVRHAGPVKSCPIAVAPVAMSPPRKFGFCRSMSAGRRTARAMCRVH